MADCSYEQRHDLLQMKEAVESVTKFWGVTHMFTLHLSEIAYIIPEVKWKALIKYLPFCLRLKWFAFFQSSCQHQLMKALYPSGPYTASAHWWVSLLVILKAFLRLTLGIQIYVINPLSNLIYQQI